MKPYFIVDGNINSRTLYIVGNTVKDNEKEAIEEVEKGNCKTIEIDGEQFGIIEAMGTPKRSSKTMVRAKNSGVAWYRVK